MSLRALKIVEEEIALAQERNDPLNEQAVSYVLDTVEARIRDRIERECIEIPEGTYYESHVERLGGCRCSVVCACPTR